MGLLRLFREENINLAKKASTMEGMISELRGEVFTRLEKIETMVNTLQSCVNDQVATNHMFTNHVQNDINVHQSRSK